MAEITDTGYILSTQNEWYITERDMYLNIDSDWNLDVSTPDGLKLASDAELYANLDEALQSAYNSKDINKAVDNELDILCALTGTTRSEGSYSTITLHMSGTDDNVIIPQGSRVRDPLTGLIWEADADYGPLDAFVYEDPVNFGTFTCTTTGANTASIGSITEIMDTVSGWRSVTNDELPTLGSGTQSNASLRLEQKVSVAKQSNNQIDSVYAELFATDGVLRAKVYSNTTDAPDANGVPARNTYALVHGGAQSDVSRAIFNTKSIGTPWYLAASVQIVEDVASLVHPSNVQKIEWCRPNYVPQNIDIVIENGGDLPSSTADDIKQAIVDYALTGLQDVDAGFNAYGFDIGEDVALGRLQTPINYVIGPYATGAYVSSLTVNGSSGPLIPTAFNELATFDVSLITVTVNG